MEFLQLPPEVIEGVLLPFLSWNDLLRFRRVCRTTKVITDYYLQANSALAPELEINEESQTFGKFLEMGIPTRKIYLKNTSGYEFYDKDRENMTLFLEQHGRTITSLRVDQLSIFVFGNELEFLNTLINLRSLVVGHFGYGRKGNSDQSEAGIYTFLDKYFTQLRQSNLESERSVIPQFMKRLQVLHVGQEEDTWRKLRKCVDRTGLVYWQENDATLDQVSLPLTSYTEPLGPPFPEHLQDSMYTLTLALVYVATEIEARAAETTRPPKAKVVDFVNFHDPGIPKRTHFISSMAFLQLCEISGRCGVKLRNVSPIWFAAFGADRFNSPQLGAPVLSLVGLHPCILRLEMVNLEKVEIKATSSNSVGPHWRGRRPEWPALKTLDITVDSKTSVHFENVLVRADQTVSVETQSLFEFLFEDVVRENMAELRFQFTEEAESVAVPNVTDVVRSCPNLKKLTVVNWPGTSKQLTELFEGLPELEEVTLENCRGLENVAFVGRNCRRPAFLNLSKLRKLSLKGLDQMPKINDLLFTRVIRHLPLTHLTLMSDHPLKSVSVKGIRALLEGTFAQSIEKFSFQDFSLAGVSKRELAKLEQQFRSHDML